MNVKYIDDLPYPVECASIPYKGVAHFGMAWLFKNAEGETQYKITLLDPEDAQIVYRDLGKWLRGGFPDEPEKENPE